MIEVKYILADSEVLLVMEKPIIVPMPDGVGNIHTRLLIATAGYKNKLLIGTEDSYQGGHMHEFTGKEMPLDFNPKKEHNFRENLLFTKIERIALKKLCKDAHQVSVENLRVPNA